MGLQSCSGGCCVPYQCSITAVQVMEAFSTESQKRGVVWVGRRSLKAHSVPMLGAVTTPQTHSYSGFSGGTFLLD